MCFTVATSRAIAATYSVLSLGSREDARTWAKGMQGNLGLAKGIEVLAPNPSLAQIKSFFMRSDDWLFMAGHFSDHLYNEGDTIGVYFEKAAVRIRHQGQEVTLKKGDGFKQHQNVKVVFWGGCSVHDNPDQVRIFRELFGSSAVYVGWRETTGWQILDINLGGKGTGPAPHVPNFFTLMNNSAKPSQVMEAWLKSADAITWGKDDKGFPVRPKFSVIDGMGDEWILRGDLQPRGGWEKSKRKF